MAEEELNYEHLDIDPGTIFEEGAASGVAEFQEQLEEQLAAEGMTQEEIEAFFDPAPRKGKRGHGKVKNCSAKQWKKMPQVCSGNRRYDPAPRSKTMKRTAYHNSASDYMRVHHNWRPVTAHSRRTYDPAPVKHHKKAKGLIAGLKDLVLPGAVIATVYSKYVERATALKAAGAILDGKLVDGVFAALQYDLKNRPTSSIMDRMKTNASKILTPAILGVGVKYAAKKVKLHPKVNQVASMGGDGLIGNAIGTIISTILDPPNPSPVNNLGNNLGNIRLVDNQSQPQPPAAASDMSVSTPGGYY